MPHFAKESWNLSFRSRLYLYLAQGSQIPGWCMSHKLSGTLVPTGVVLRGSVQQLPYSWKWSLSTCQFPRYKHSQFKLLMFWQPACKSPTYVNSWLSQGSGSQLHAPLGSQLWGYTILKKQESSWTWPTAFLPHYGSRCTKIFPVLLILTVPSACGVLPLLFLLRKEGMHPSRPGWKILSGKPSLASLGKAHSRSFAHTCIICLNFCFSY